jgi:hypothetical protein
VPHDKLGTMARVALHHIAHNGVPSVMQHPITIMRTLLVAIYLSSIAFPTVTMAQTTKPTLVVADDGFPSGHETPEGAACDLARAFIKCDDALFTKTCIRLYAGDSGPESYAQFLKGTAKTIRDAGKKGASGGPKSIGKVFAARHFSKDGPASYGYASFGFQDVMFVDVGVFLQNDEHALNRTLIIKDKDGRWYAHPMPDASPLLSAGLNDETPSEQDFSEVYDIRK